MPHADVNGTNIYYNVYGEGEPVVFIHGVAITSRVWGFQRDTISRHYKMITYDLRGSGKSEKTPGIYHTSEMMAEDLKGLLDYLRIYKTNIVGLSLGAAVAMKFAIDYPERVDKLVLSGAFADLNGILGFSSKYFSFLIGKVLMTRAGGELATKVMLPSSPQDDLLFYHRNIISVDSDEVRKYSQILNSYTISAALGKVQAPTLIMYGQHEGILHRQGAVIAKAIRGSKMVIVPGVGHGWNGEKPELFNEYVLRFIRDGDVKAL